MEVHILGWRDGGGRVSGLGWVGRDSLFLGERWGLWLGLIEV